MIDPRELRKFLVYVIRNNVDQKSYYGITKTSLSIRWNQHKHNAIRNKKHTHLSNAIRKYGVDAFSIELVKNCDTELEMYDLERRLIKTHQSNNPKFGYNNSEGGEASTKGSKRSREYCERLSIFQRTRKRTPFNEVTKLKMSLVAKGRNMKKAIEASANSRRGCPALNSKPIILNGERRFNSMKEAARLLGCTPTVIARSISGKIKESSFGKFEYAKS